MDFSFIHEFMKDMISTCCRRTSEHLCGFLDNCGNVCIMNISALAWGSQQKQFCGEPFLMNQVQ